MRTKRLAFLFFLAALLLVPATLCAQYRRQTNLPALYLTTFDGGGIQSKTDYKYCRMHYVDETDVLTFYDSVSVRGRGNSTWGLAKKPYRFKFLNKEKFLGKGYANAKKWTLLANAGDKTLIRNALTSEMGLFCAALRGPSEPKSLPFNPAVRFVDFTLNGVYQGTYQISDQVEVRPHRVNITEQAVPLAPGDDISGGYLLETDGFMDGNSFRTAIYDAPVRIHYPDDEDILARQTAYVKQHIARFESALSSSSFTDPETGYRAFVDTASLVDWYICTELTANVDGFYSTYFYKERGDDRLFFGPLWDYDIAYNNDWRYSSTLRLLMSATAMRSSSGPASRTFCWPKRTASPLCSRPLRRSTIRSGASTCACTTSWCFIPATAVTSPTSSPSSARVAPSSARPSRDAVRPSLLCRRSATTASWAAVPRFPWASRARVLCS